MCGKADMGETKAFCLHNTLSHHTLETPVNIVVLVRNNKNSVRPEKLKLLLMKPPSVVCGEGSMARESYNRTSTSAGGSCTSTRKSTLLDLQHFLLRPRHITA